MSRREPAILVAATVVALIVSRIGATEPGTWVLEVFPIFLALPILIATASGFRSLRSRIGCSSCTRSSSCSAGTTPTRRCHSASGCRTPLHLGAKPLRPARPLRAGLRPRHRRARGPAAPLAAPAREVALLPRHLRLSRRQRVLRAHRVARRGPRRLLRRRLPRHPGRRLGHAVGHVHGPRRRDRRAARCSRACTTGRSSA